MTTARIGYAAMLEQFGPGEIVDLCALAETAGFSGVMARTTSSRGSRGKARPRSCGKCWRSPARGRRATSGRV